MLAIMVMWHTLQQPSSDDYVVATGSVTQFLDYAAKPCGLE